MSFCVAGKGHNRQNQNETPVEIEPIEYNPSHPAARLGTTRQRSDSSVLEEPLAGNMRCTRTSTCRAAFPVEVWAAVGMEAHGPILGRVHSIAPLQQANDTKLERQLRLCLSLRLLARSSDTLFSVYRAGSRSRLPETMVVSSSWQVCSAWQSFAELARLPENCKTGTSGTCRLAGVMRCFLPAHPPLAGCLAVPPTVVRPYLTLE